MESTAVNKPQSSPSTSFPSHPVPSFSSPSPSSSSSSSSSYYFSPLPPSSRTIYSDRFIPSRSSSNFDLFNLSSPSPSPSTTTTTPQSTPSSSSSSDKDSAGPTSRTPSAYSAVLRAVLFGDSPVEGVKYSSPSSISSGSGPTTPSSNIFRFKTELPRRSLFPAFDADQQHPLLLPGYLQQQPKPPRKIARSPFKVLDAPVLEDDFYLNLVDWSLHNVLAVGLGNCVYLWNACSSKVTKLCDLGTDDSVCSVGWAQRGTHLAVGTNQGKLQIWDTSRCRRIRIMEGHRQRIGALAWSSSLLSSGSRDKSILQRDIRSQEDFVSKLAGHKSEVCGLKWSYDNRELASGGNDNKLFVWNQHSTQPVLKYCEHTAAVKAIAWSPHLHGLLASGAGTADQCIRFWNTTTNSHLSSINTGSQVCNLAWSKNVNELVSTHGYSQNQIIVWRYPSMSKLATLTGHTYRVLYLAISPDGQTIVTGAGDETLRFWNVFPSPKFQNTGSDIGANSLGRSHIR